MTLEKALEKTAQKRREKFIMTLETLEWLFIKKNLIGKKEALETF